MLHKLRTQHLYSFMAGLLLSTPGSLFAANDLVISDVPMQISSSVSPNVMLLLDNSGSMENIVWHDNFDVNTVYDSWCGNCVVDDRDRWDPVGTYMTLASINSGRPQGRAEDPGGICGTQNLASVSIDDPVSGQTDVVERFRVQGENQATGAFSCLILPDILGSGGTRYTGNYLNYLFQTYNDGDDLTNVIPYKTRLTVMKQVTTELISSTTGMRFGLTAFDGSDGGQVLASCGTTATDVSTAINDLAADSSTPLAEAMYEITRYFRGLRPENSVNGNSFTSPIQYRCQKNFVIAVTDGLPSQDNDVPTSDPDINQTCTRLINAIPPLATGTCSLPNWDQRDDSNALFPRFADGPGGINEGQSLFFDDIAKFAYDVDLRTSPAIDANNTDFDAEPFVIQNIQTYAVGFSIANQMLEDAGYYGSGSHVNDPETTGTPNYFSANNHGDLLNDLQNTLDSIAGRSGSASSAAASTGYIGSTGTSLYQATFGKSESTGAWTGNLIRHLLVYDQQGNGVSINITTDNASTQLSSLLGTDAQGTTPATSTNRSVFSIRSDTNQGIEFHWANISTAQRALLNDQEEILNYIRGDQACETSSTATCPAGQIKDLRDRNTDGTGFLGTIVNSSPIYIAKPLEYYPHTWSGTTAPENDLSAEAYTAFKTTHENRVPILYVGANDGMLHALDADTLNERFSFVPGAVYSQLTDYTGPNYNHKFYVDGTPNIIDVFYGSNVGGTNIWRTVLVGGLNKGGQGIYALDVTNPESFGTRNVLWEFTDTDDRDLGYTYSRPAVIRMHNDRWAAVFGNGYNSTEIDDGDSNNDGVVDINDDTANNDSESGNAVLYIVDIHTGALIKKIDTGVGAAQDPTGNNRPNGLSTVAPMDIDNDYVVDFIYAGDLFGNLWRFDVRSTSTGAWGISGKGGNPSTISPVFVALDNANNPQPITARPDATFTDTGALMLYFGTGQYLQFDDRSDASQQSFYALLDNPEVEGGSQVTRADMLLQEIEQDGVSFDASETVRRFSNNASSNQYISWHIDFPASGERVVGAATVRGISRKRVIFTSIIPTVDSCDFGGSSWLTELDARNGNRTSNAVFDLNFDGVLDSMDNGGNGQDVYNGWRQSGLSTAPTILTDSSGGRNSELKIISSSTGTLRAVGEAPQKETNGSRQSWRQIK